MLSTERRDDVIANNIHSAVNPHIRESSHCPRLHATPLHAHRLRHVRVRERRGVQLDDRR